MPKIRLRVVVRLGRSGGVCFDRHARNVHRSPDEDEMVHSRRTKPCAPPMHETCDAIVIGGGPAGSLSARFLAQLGWDVVIIERGLRHRAKTCGHCLNPRATAILHEAGLYDRVTAAARSTYVDSALHLAGCPPVRLSLGTASSTRGLVIARSRLDQILLDAAAEAGARVFQPCLARVVDLDAGRVDISLTHDTSRPMGSLRAPLMIGADGLRSAVARAMTPGVTPTTIGRKFGCSFSMDCDDAAWRAATSGLEDCVHMAIGSGTYIGLVRDGGRLHVGLLADVRRGATRHPLMICRMLARDIPVLRDAGLDRVSRSTMHEFVAAGPMPWRAASVATKRAALVGDAAGYIEPFTGEGMLWAMASATALRDVVAAVTPGAWSAELASAYRRVWRERIGMRHHWCRTIVAIVERPRLMRALAPCLAWFPPISSAIARRAVPA